MANMGTYGWVKKRRGLYEHYQDGRLGNLEGRVFEILLTFADFNTGMWFGNWSDVIKYLPMDLREGPNAGNVECKVRYALRSLHTKGYIEKPTKSSAKRYPIWIDKYEVREDSYINAGASLACGKPVCYTVGEDGSFVKEPVKEAANEARKRPERDVKETRKSDASDSSVLEGETDAKKLKLRSKKLNSRSKEQVQVPHAPSESVQPQEQSQKQKQNPSIDVQAELDKKLEQEKQQEKAWADYRAERAKRALDEVKPNQSTLAKCKHGLSKSSICIRCDDENFEEASDSVVERAKEILKTLR